MDKPKIYFCYFRGFQRREINHKLTPTNTKQKPKKTPQAPLSRGELKSRCFWQPNLIC